MSGITKNGYSASRGSRASSYSQRHHPYGSGSRNDRSRSRSPAFRGRSDRGGNSRGGGGSGGCFKCGESGHWARECPSAGNSSRGSGGGGCFKCGENGHFARECPNASRMSLGGRSARSNSSAPSSEHGIKWGQPGAGLASVDWDKMDLAPFTKEFYHETSSTAAQTETQIAAWKKEHNIECYAGFNETLKNAGTQGYGGPDYSSWNRNYDDEANEESAQTSHKDPKSIPKPLMAFEDAGFAPVVMKAIQRAGFDKPTPIQSLCWPIIMSGYNVIGIAKTGSGKTLAFTLPVLTHIEAQPRLKYGDGPIALIIAPTRELACQIEVEVDKFSHLKHVCVYGGVKKYDQRRKLRQGAEVIIATPGRLLDFLETGTTNLRRITYVVIDEADRLLDMGFEPQLNAVMGQVRPDRQMCMFSATWPVEVRRLAKKFMVPKDDDDSNIMQVAIGAMDKLKANENVTQIIHFTEQHQKIRDLKKTIDAELEKDKMSKILVFISTKRMCNQLNDMLWEDGYYCTCIHGNKEQPARDKALSDFKSGKINIMLATDVASRGIHVDDIKLVVNFDFPTQIEDYVHRIGRTGRAGSKGTAISFFVEAVDASRAKGLIKIMKTAKQKVPDELYSMRAPRKKGRFGGGRFYGRRY